MATSLNTVGETPLDNLIYDHYRLLDAKVVEVNVTGGPGTLKRGQIIDFDESKKEYSAHAAAGKANCIVAENTEYTAEDTKIPVTVYISGNFRKSCVVSTVDLDAADEENLRSKEIVLK